MKRIPTSSTGGVPKDPCHSQAGHGRNNGVEARSRLLKEAMGNLLITIDFQAGVMLPSSGRIALE